MKNLNTTNKVVIGNSFLYMFIDKEHRPNYIKLHMEEAAMHSGAPHEKMMILALNG